LFILPLLIGLLGLYRVTQSSQFESYRTMDFVQPVASGACLGAALAVLIVAALRLRG
jgi:hypothetical protein